MTMTSTETAPDHKALVERLRAFAQEPTPVLCDDANMAREAAQAITDLLARVEGLERREAELLRQVYVPGLRKCAKCGCAVISTALDVTNGRAAAINGPQDCPNGCGPAWPVTERTAGNELCDRLELAEARAATLSASLGEAVGALTPFAEGARNAAISGHPPFVFVSATDYERAASVLASLRTSGDGV